MIHIYIVVLAIVLGAVAAVGGISYIHAEAPKASQTEALAASGFRSMDSAFSSYRMANGSQPSGLSALDAYLPLGIPTAPAGLSWTYGTAAGKAWFCLSGQNLASGTVKGLRNTASKQPAVIVEDGAACNPVISTAVDDSSTAIWLTYWVVR